VYFIDFVIDLFIIIQEVVKQLLYFPVVFVILATFSKELETFSGESELFAFLLVALLYHLHLNLLISLLLSKRAKWSFKGIDLGQ
jgi:hypothetical protein